MSVYDYDSLLQDIATFPTVFTAGHSAFGRAIPCVAIGGGGGMLIHGAIHAREHVTAPVVVAMARAYIEAFALGGLPPCDFVPMVNPDGVELCAHGLASAPARARARLLAINRGEDFRLWKANGLGVDPNVNFPAAWGEGESNVFAPAPSDYVGAYPLCAPESATLVRLTRRRAYTMTLSYHCKGEVIYYGFGTGATARHSQAAATYLAQFLGYAVCTSVGSAGGYKDWYALTHPHGVALTVEIGADRHSHPFPYGELSTLIAQHRDVPRYMAAFKE
jgi:g-D-glutamyl-meso-diaminopimelate peptidase